MATDYARSWEHSLLALAQEASHPAVPHTPRTSVPISDANVLDQAYAKCEAIIAEHGKTFNLATGLLPPPKRRAMRALYAFCRVTDNIVDSSDDPLEVKEGDLKAWRYRSVTASPPHDDPSLRSGQALVALAWADTRLRYNIPYVYCEQLIDGVARDLYRQRYESFDDLALYAYGVASTVGLMMLRIIGTAPGVTEEEAMPYAIKMGLALQITNILRDVGEDRRAGRVYLPANELEAWGLEIAEWGVRSTARSHSQIETIPYSAFHIPHSIFRIPHLQERWQDFMRFQVARNYALYREAWPCVRMFARDGRFCVAAMCSLYRAILDDIEAHDYDVFSRRAHVSTWGKLRRLPALWWQSQGSRSRVPGEAQGSRSAAAVRDGAAGR